MAHPDTDVLMSSADDLNDSIPTDELPNPAQPASPIKDDTQVMTEDEVVVTGIGKSSKAKNVVAKVISKDEPSFGDKGKATLDLPNVEAMDPEAIQAI